MVLTSIILGFTLLATGTPQTSAPTVPNGPKLQATEKTLSKYWEEISSSGTFMGGKRLHQLTAQYGEIWHAYTVVINTHGIPTQYRLVSIKPAVSVTDADLFRQDALLSRFQASTENAKAEPVLYRANVRSWIPKGDVELPAATAEPSH